MKVLTCREMGGPCDTPIRGNTASEMTNNGAAHLKSMNDDGHNKALAMMDEMQKNPEEAKKWNDEFAKKFAALPDEN